MFTSTGQRSPEGCCNNWNSRYSGKECLTAIGSHGYKHGNVLGTGMLAHRVIFYLSYGYLPKYVDHKNGNRTDNRPKNLREATNAQNIANSNSRKGSSSKYLGVCFSKNHGKWLANITSNNKNYYIGIYSNEVDAALAYNEQAKRLHGDFANINVI